MSMCIIKSLAVTDTSKHPCVVQNAEYSFFFHITFYESIIEHEVLNTLFLLNRDQPFPFKI